MMVVKGRKMIPSSGQSQLPLKAAMYMVGRAIHQRIWQPGGGQKRPVERINRAFYILL